VHLGDGHRIYRDKTRSNSFHWRFGCFGVRTSAMSSRVTKEPRFDRDSTLGFGGNVASQFAATVLGPAELNKIA
jgi:hypothetical protein